MTVLEAAAQWLRGYEGLEGMEFSVSRLEAETEACGLFRAPGGGETVFVDGSRDVTACFLLWVRFPAQTDALRREAHEWLDGLEAWIRAQNRRGSLPELGGGRVCFGVSVSAGSAPGEQTEDEIFERLTLAVSYQEEGKT